MTRVGARVAAALVAAIALALALAGTAAGSGLEVTRGTFGPVPGHPDDFGVTGVATMIRVHGKTLVFVHLRGLEPGQVYPVHVHDTPCAAGGGGHYKHDPTGPAAPPNELWPSSFGLPAGIAANAFGRGIGWASADWVARPEAQSIVVHYYANTAIRVACAQLS